MEAFILDYGGGRYRELIPSFLLPRVNSPRFGGIGGLHWMSGLALPGVERDEPLCLKEQPENVFTKALQKFSRAFLLKRRYLAIPLLSHILPG
jgi:hypothetical protein